MSDYPTLLAAYEPAKVNGLEPNLMSSLNTKVNTRMCTQQVAMLANVSIILQ